MAIDKIRKDVHKLIDEVNDEDRLELVKEMLELEIEFADSPWNKLSTEEKEGIEEGLAQLDKGEGKSYEEVRENIKKKHGI